MYERAEFANERLDGLKTGEFAFPLTIMRRITYVVISRRSAAFSFALFRRIQEDRVQDWPFMTPRNDDGNAKGDGQ